MEPSRRDLSAVAVVVALLVMAAGMVAPAHAATCRRLSGKFKGWCLINEHCTDACKSEGKGYTDGYCDGPRSGLGIVLHCYCRFPCAAAAPVADQSGGAMDMGLE